MVTLPGEWHQMTTCSARICFTCSAEYSAVSPLDTIQSPGETGVTMVRLTPGQSAKGEFNSSLCLNEPASCAQLVVLVLHSARPGVTAVASAVEKKKKKML